MKKTILTALLLVAISTAFAQTTQPTKPTTPPAPVAAPAPVKQFTPDFSKPVTLQIKVPLAVLSNYAYGLENPNYAVGDLAGKNIAIIQRSSAAIADSIYTNYNRIIKAQHDTWAADTLKQFNAKKEIKK